MSTIKATQIHYILEDPTKEQIDKGEDHLVLKIQNNFVGKSNTITLKSFNGNIIFLNFTVKDKDKDSVKRALIDIANNL